MKVINFNTNDFVDFLRVSLEEFSTTQQKILILGIAEGGIPIAEIVGKYFNENTQNVISEKFVKVQRPSTKVKKKNAKNEKLLKGIFSILPTFILDYLRVAEHKKLSKRRAHDLVREVQWSNEEDFSKYDFIFIVDDAVDSGASMKAVVDALTGFSELLKIKTLSVVVTQKRPVFLPDYYLFRDVLIRFPWSLDGKK